MDQVDLFSQDYTPAAEVGVTPIEVDTPPVQTPPKGDALPNILLFATQHQKQMWKSFKHRRDCMMMVTGFASFQDIGARPLDQIKQRDIINYRTYLQTYGKDTRKGRGDTPFTNSTINRHLSAISACFRYALEELDLIEDRPRSCLLKEEEPNTRAFTPEIIAQLVEHFVQNGDQWMADMVTLASKTGMRQGEIVSVHLHCVTYDEVENQIWLPPAITKSKKGRYVPLTADGAFEAYQRLVLNIGREYTHGRFYSRWWDAKDALGYSVGGRTGDDSWFKFHATRHTAATRMANANVSTLVVGNILGHSDPKTTKKYYHGDASARGAAAAIL